MVRGVMKETEEQFAKYHFARCSHGYLVNLKYVQKILGDQVFVGGDALPISRPRRKEFLNALAQYKGGSH